MKRDNNRQQRLTTRCPRGIAFGLLLGMFFVAASLPQHTLGQGLSREQSYTSSIDFIASYVSEEAGEQTQTLWLHGDLKTRAADILGHRFNGLRVRYWGENNRTVWVLDEIGKELPITIGVVVEDEKILDIHILEYRETRGGEVRYPFFTRQFKGLTLNSGDDYRLNGHIDGITGATLSVSAVRKIAILALVFHQHTPYSAG